MRSLITPEPPPRPADLLGRESARGFSWEQDVILTSGGRNAYALGLRMLRLREQTRILLPALCCGALVSATKAVKAIPVFYELRDDLSPDLEWLEKHRERAEAMVVIHYLGFPQPMQETVEFCKRTGMLLIEDCAHALYSRVDGKRLGSSGAFSFFSIRKVLPAPGGGILAWNEAHHLFSLTLSRPLLSELLSTSRYFARYAENLLRVSPRLWLLKNEGLRRAVATRDAAATPVLRGSARVSARVLSHVDSSATVALRRKNYCFLLHETDGHANGCPLPRALSDGVSPMGFPLFVQDRPSFIRQMLREGIVVRPLWLDLPLEVDEARYPIASRIGRRLAYAPVHQGMRDGQLERVSAALKKCLK
ncbi:DegT/DnrJ/EryC1/StrS aminotransferase family protein [Candidatus Poribacteria bacterium]|nr:DegT/DnrJ/EryC1/StrS aminotransferase family protein [Candidatus Poribacteria bacterium]